MKLILWLCISTWGQHPYSSVLEDKDLAYKEALEVCQSYHETDCLEPVCYPLEEAK